MQNLSISLGNELIGLNNLVEEQQYYIDKLQLKAAMYKASFYGKSELAEKLNDQLHDNNLCGCDFISVSGLLYRNLEDMYMQDILTKTEYDFCRAI